MRLDGEFPTGAAWHAVVLGGIAGSTGEGRGSRQGDGGKVEGGELGGFGQTRNGVRLFVLDLGGSAVGRGPREGVCRRGLGR